MYLQPVEDDGARTKLNGKVNGYKNGAANGHLHNTNGHVSNGSASSANGLHHRQVK